MLHFESPNGKRNRGCLTTADLYKMVVEHTWRKTDEATMHAIQWDWIDG